jgi:transcription termination factor NusB
MEKPVRPPGKRRLARELAVQFLYQFDLGGGSLKEALAKMGRKLT